MKSILKITNGSILAATICGGTLFGFTFAQQKSKLIPEVIGDIEWSGPCAGFVLSRWTAGLDYATVADIRDAAHATGLDPCVAEEDPPGNRHEPYFEIYTRREEEAKVTQVCEADPTIRCNSFAADFDGSYERVGSIDKLYFFQMAKPKLLMSSGSDTMQRVSQRLGLGAAKALNTILTDPKYLRLSHKLKPRAFVISTRSAGASWHGEVGYDACFDFGQFGVHRFQIIPDSPVLYCGKLFSFSYPQDFGDNSVKLELHEHYRGAFLVRYVTTGEASQPSESGHIYQIPVDGIANVGRLDALELDVNSSSSFESGGTIPPLWRYGSTPPTDVVGLYSLGRNPNGDYAFFIGNYKEYVYAKNWMHDARNKRVGPSAISLNGRPPGRNGHE